MTAYIQANRYHAALGCLCAIGALLSEGLK